MARNDGLPITDRILAIRELWHTKRHPFFLAFGEGKLPLRALGRYQALHYHFVSRALASFGMLYARGYHFEDVRKMIAENIAEEEGLKAILEPGHEPHDHNELILRFCRAAGLSDDEVRNTKMPPAWWARSLYIYHTTANEPVGVILAMQTTQEGQMPGLIGRLDIAFNNAGTLGEAGPSTKVSEAGWNDAIAINLTGSFLGAKHQIAEMLKHGGGSVIFTSTFVGYSFAFAGVAAYAASKSGLIGLTQALAAEFGPRGVRVNAILPGAVETGMYREMNDTADKQAFMTNLHALKRVAQPEELAHSVLYLASDDSAFVTGTASLVDGGASITRS